MRAKREGWDDLERFARPRPGSSGGGGFEYHVSLLPDAMQAALMAEVSKEVTLRNVSERREVETVKRQALDSTALTVRQRDVMNARSVVLSAIESVQVTEGRTRSQTVDLFLQGGGQFGVDDAVLTEANDRKNGSATISRRTVLRWFQFRDQNGIGALAPKATKERAEIPDWFWNFLAYYARPQKPCMTEALDDFLRSSPGVNEPVTYAKVRRLIGKLGNVEKHRGREGSLTLKARMAYVTRSTSDLLPTCVYTSDGKTFDAEIAHPIHGRPFRPEVTSVVDVATRKCVGFSVGLGHS
ncbi:DNA-binding protein [uncultured Pelagimonas sp.]|uniref:DNA-binding protein n=1 Tax=uncultured Pelagimonas sp. TaxID=1618102 RepID=UPI00341CC796